MVRLYSRLFIVLFILLLIRCKHADHVRVIDVSLDGSWFFHKSGDTHWLPAKVPGNVISDLARNKVIADPYFRINVNSDQWIGKNDWVYQKTFDLSPDILKQDVIQISFEGLDTYADVTLNDSVILKADNMFRSWTMDCKNLLRLKANRLQVYFHSPVNEGLRKKKKLPYHLAIEDEQGPGDSLSSAFTRKASFQYGWDGGPRLIPSGIWRPVHLLAWSGAKIENIYFKPIQVSSKLAIYNAEITIRSTLDQRLRLELMVNRKSVIGATDIFLLKGLNTKSLSFTINDPRLWWPNGLGSPSLYDLKVLLKKEDEVEDCKINELGIRKVELVQQPDSLGTSFYFMVNDVPVYMKGANYVPENVLTGNVDPQKLKQLISFVQKANMNMLRVWGGGIYQDQSFYDLCDKNGILVWQDFMFSSSMQPADSLHINNIRHEAEENVIRLRNHPCLALWCGNSEIMENWDELDWDHNYNQDITRKLHDNYRLLFNRLLPEVVKKLDENIPYIASTPSSIDSNDTAISGDQHDWSVWYNGAPFEAYNINIGRFVSEFGMQSLPSLVSLKQFSIPSDLHLNSEVMMCHQHNSVSFAPSVINGNDLIYKYCKDYYKETDDFATITYLSQVMQSEALRSAIEYQRRAKPRCMGSLYWQLNDCWPAISWSTIDYYNRLKLSYYTVSNAFAPIVVIPVRENKLVNIYGVSDLLKNTDAILLARLIDFHGKTWYVKQIPVKIEANSSKILSSINVAKMLHGLNINSCCLVVQLNQPNKTLTHNILYFVRPKDLLLPKASINVNVNEAVSGYNLILKSDVLVKNVGLETNSGTCEFSDNNFDLLPGKRAKINVQYDGTRKQLIKDLKIYSINNYGIKN